MADSSRESCILDRPHCIAESLPTFVPHLRQRERRRHHSIKRSGALRGLYTRNSCRLAQSGAHHTDNVFLVAVAALPIHHVFTSQAGAVTPKQLAKNFSRANADRIEELLRTLVSLR